MNTTTGCTVNTVISCLAQLQIISLVLAREAPEQKDEEENGKTAGGDQGEEGARGRAEGESVTGKLE